MRWLVTFHRILEDPMYEWPKGTTSRDGKNSTQANVPFRFRPKLPLHDRKILTKLKLVVA